MADDGGPAVYLSSERESGPEAGRRGSRDPAARAKAFAPADISAKPKANRQSWRVADRSDDGGTKMEKKYKKLGRRGCGCGERGRKSVGREGQRKRSSALLDCCCCSSTPAGTVVLRDVHNSSTSTSSSSSTAAPAADTPPSTAGQKRSLSTDYDVLH